MSLADELLADLEDDEVEDEKSFIEKVEIKSEHEDSDSMSAMEMEEG